MTRTRSTDPTSPPSLFDAAAMPNLSYAKALEDSLYQRARLLVVMAYTATAAAPALARQAGSAKELRRCAVSASSKLIQAWEGKQAHLDDELSRLHSAIHDGERQGWLSAEEAERIDRVGRELRAAI